MTATALTAPGDTELLELKSANVRATVDRISADVHTMKRGLDELQATWRGSTSSNNPTAIAAPAYCDTADMTNNASGGRAPRRCLRVGAGTAPDCGPVSGRRGQPGQGR